jgi:hypothetical protein
MGAMNAHQEDLCSLGIYASRGLFHGEVSDIRREGAVWATHLHAGIHKTGDDLIITRHTLRYGHVQQCPREALRQRRDICDERCHSPKQAGP